MGAHVDAVDTGTVLFEGPYHPEVDAFDRLHRDDPLADALLVGDYDDEITTAVHKPYGLGDTGKKFESRPLCHVMSFDHLSVDDPVAVKKDRRPHRTLHLIILIHSYANFLQYPCLRFLLPG